MGTNSTTVRDQGETDQEAPYQPGRSGDNKG